MNNNTNKQNKYKNIKVALWNANSVAGKMGELTHFLYTHKIDIITLSETKLAPDTPLTLRNYTIHRSDRTRRGGGVAILIKNSLPHIALPQTNSNIEHISIKLWNGVVVTSCYLPP